ncbi:MULTISPECIES: PTS sugar transporter subunit IIA [Virgibacillus]|uniref:PTS sugar transporter subunit IIA n=1 Tax=Virgibacillus salarius TaxID=447199 RepID=A0A941I8Z7_9BACI|nr:MULTISPECIES: fructose PTS transporter subunit IIA [Bacillaceae]MBR7795003.1 PTS sugar transporter subunit IIA [Virgibacillus salarius]NAZ07723.1 PTS transporter subunit EIIA [Agaribacter marinus]
MKHLINKDFIQLQATASSQQGVFQAIADIAKKHGIASSAEAIIEGLKQRELQSTTGFQDGFAIPHTQTEAVEKPAIIIVRTETGIEWESFDGQPAFFFLSLLIPKSEAGSTHLQALSALSRALMDEEVRQSMLDATTNEQLANIVATAISGGEI